MIDLIRELIRFLSQDMLTVEDVIGRVGPVAHDPGGLMPIELQPVLASVRAAHLYRYPDTGLPYALMIDPEPNTGLTVADLQQAFGDYERLLTDRGRPPEIIFYPPPAGSRWKVAVIADLQSAAGPLDRQSVISLMLQRERASS